MDNQNPQNQSPPPTLSSDPRQQIVDQLKKSSNVLVTVSANPSVDQLAAAIGLTLMLHKLNKHATAVFSGEVPSTIEFLQPEETLEKNTDSLRDFIIALDRAKADKLRYKVEDKVVKIFITPYRTSISEKDLDFSQGDFNVDIVVALGVAEQTDLDQAITAHGRILHDATVATIATVQPSSLGSINWQVSTASSLSELVASLNTDLGKNLLDEQTATALLTGIVAETDRFSNDKTTPQTMSVSAQLMSAGANQQLVATKLEPPTAPPEPAPQSATSPPTQPLAGPAAAEESTKPDDGTLEVPHDEDLTDQTEEAAPINQQIDIDEKGTIRQLNKTPLPETQPAPGAFDSSVTGGSRMITQPPTFGGTLTAETVPEANDPSTDGLALPEPEDMLHHGIGGEGASGLVSASPNAGSSGHKTLSQLEQAAHEMPKTDAPAQPSPSLDSLRDEVNRAAAGSPSNTPLPPMADSPVGVPQPLDTIVPDHPAEQPDASSTLNMPAPPSFGSLFNNPTPPANPSNPNAPPPLPPPIQLP